MGRRRALAGRSLHVRPPRRRARGRSSGSSDGHWAVGEGRLVRSIFGKGPIPFTAPRSTGGHIATRPTAFLSRDDDDRLREGQQARLVVRGAWVWRQRPSAT